MWSKEVRNCALTFVGEDIGEDRRFVRAQQLSAGVDIAELKDQTMLGEFRMPNKISLTARVLLAVLPCLILSALANAQSTPGPSLQDHLNATYKTGTILVVQKAGIVSVRPTYRLHHELTYFVQEKFLRPPYGPVKWNLKTANARDLAIGEKVSVTKMELNPKGDKITFHTTECDSCNVGMASSSNNANLIFQFAKGYLATAEPSKVQDEINRVFAIDTAKDSARSSAVATQEKQEKMTEPPPPPLPPPAPPKTIEVGQTIEQVVAALGQPVKIVKLGTKEMYFYKDLKITFADGKVSDVE